MAEPRNLLKFHLGITLFSLFPAVIIGLLFHSAVPSLLWILLVNLIGLTRAQFLIVLSFHFLKPISSMLGDQGFAPERMVIQLSSIKTLKKLGGSIPADRILLLLPHCLQNHQCGLRITFDPYNCKECGKCPVGDLVSLARNTGVSLAVATGGTLARRHVKELNPLAVVAVACPRDLGQGILDAYPVPVFGVENSRPCGDCLDTQVDIAVVEKALENLTS